MSNKYANLDGSKKIREEYTKINAGFDAVEADINAVNGRVDTIITTPIDGEAAAQEVVDARSGFSTIGARMTNIETDLISHKADKAPHPNIPAAQVYHWLNQSIPHSTHTILAFADEVFDTDNMHNSTYNSRLTCNTPGIYLIIASVDFDITDVGSRNIAILRNGITVAQQSNKGTPDTFSSLTISTLLYLDVGDYVEVDIYQTSGIALNVRGQQNSSSSSVFSMIRVGG